MRAFLALLLAAACYDPSIEPGGLRCSADGECPAGYHCDRAAFCWKDGTAPAATAPGAPRNVTVQTGPNQATVSWFVPADTGGSAIVNYRVSAAPGAATALFAADATSGVLTGLTAEATYTFSVTALNGAGESLPAEVIARIPGLPAAPAMVSALAGVKSATVTWHASADNGSPIVSYTVTAIPGGASAVVAGDTTFAVVTGLDNDTSYTFTVTGVNAVGSSPAATSAAATTATVPAAPQQVHATAGSGELSVTWAPPSDNGGSPVVSYTVSTVPAGGTVAMGAYTATVSGLVAGTAYEASVLASNAAGDGAPAAANPVVPR